MIFSALKYVLPAAAAALLLAGAGDALAHKHKSGDLTIEHPHARVIIPTRPASGYFVVHNKGDADRLLSAASPAFGRVELHSHEMKDGTVRMFKVDGLDVPAGGMLTLASGGHHVMMFDAVKPLKVGDSFPMTLTFEKAGDVEVKVMVVPVAAAGGGGAMDHSKMDHGKMDHGTMDHGKMKH